MLDLVRVEVYGDTVPMKGVAAISVRDAQMLAVSVFDPSVLLSSYTKCSTSMSLLTTSVMLRWKHYFTHQLWHRITLLVHEPHLSQPCCERCMTDVHCCKPTL